MDALSETVTVQKCALPDRFSDSDEVAVEAPLEIRLMKPALSPERVAVLLRSPGHDLELATGYLFSQSILHSRKEILGSHAQGKLVELTVATNVDFKARLRDGTKLEHGSGPFVSAKFVSELPKMMRSSQLAFTRTGGLHASGLFNSQGECLAVREDVNAQNAIDKIVGYSLLNEMLPLEDRLLVQSDQVSFELVQKAALAGIRIIVAVGAPSSLAVKLAQELQLTLIGFARDGRFNIYHGEWRISD